MAHPTHKYSSDNIELRDAFRILWASKALIIAITIVVTSIATAYAFLSTPIYQTSVHTLPPTASGLASYNVASQLTGDAIRGTVPNSASGIPPLSTKDAYNTFLRHLNSSTIRQTFFDKFYLPAQEQNDSEADKQRAWKRLDAELTIDLPLSADALEARLVLEGKQPQAIAKWANAYVNLAAQAASEELLSGLVGEVKIRELSLRDQITTLRQMAKKTRQDSIIRLQGALSIAESIGLETPSDNLPLIAINTQSRSTESISSDLQYLRGARALRAELEQLEQRKTDDEYILELPDLLKKQALLKSINLNPDLLSVTTIDRAAIVPEDPVKPKKTLIIFLGVILGGVLSILVAWFPYVTRRGEAQ